MYSIIIDNKALQIYNEYYFKTYPRRKVVPISSPLPPSLNQWMIMPRMKMNNIKQKWKSFGLWYINELGFSNLKIEYAKVTYVYYFPTKIRHDADNMTPKFCNDFLVESGMIVDDDFNHIELIIKGFYDKENPRTEIIIEPVT